MGIKVQLNSTTLEEATQKTKTGLLLGFATTPVRIVTLIPTPPSPPGISSHRWAIEHAKVVSLIFPGGIHILGVYTLTSSNNATPAAEIISTASIARAVIDSPEDFPPLVVCNGPKGRVIAKEVLSAAEGTRPADLKIISNLNRGIVCVETAVELSGLRIPLKSGETLDQAEQKCVQAAFKLCKDVVLRIPTVSPAVITDVLDERTLADVMGWEIKADEKKKVTLFTPQEKQVVKTFVPIDVNTSDDKGEEPTDSEAEELNVISLSGSVFSHAVVMQDHTVGQLLQNVRDDLERSFKARLQLLTEVDEDKDEEEDTIASDNVGNRALPVRVVASPTDADHLNIPMSDYMMPDEIVEEEVKGRLCEVLSLDDKALEKYTLSQEEKFGLVEATQPKTFTSKRPSHPIDTGMSDLDQAASLPELYVAYGVGFAVALAFLAIVIKNVMYFF